MRTNRWIPYLFIAPFLLLFVVFRLVPIIYSLWFSVTKISGNERVYLGFINYIKLFQDPMLFQSIINTIIMFVLYILIKLPIVILISLMLEKHKNPKLYLKIVYIPTLIGMFAYAIFFRYLFTYYGIVNNVMYSLLKVRIDWFGGNLNAQLMIAIILAWGSLGVSILIFLNSLKNIDQAYYEIITINGGNLVQKVRYVIVPLLKPIIKVIVFLSFLETLTLIDIPINLTHGGPNQSTITIGYYIYIQAIQYANFSYAATIGVMLTIVSLLLLPLRNRKDELNYEIY